MWYFPGAFAVDARDVIGAWIVCLALAAAMFAPPLWDSLACAAG